MTTVHTRGNHVYFYEVRWEIILDHLFEWQSNKVDLIHCFLDVTMNNGVIPIFGPVFHRNWKKLYLNEIMQKKKKKIKLFIHSGHWLKSKYIRHYIGLIHENLYFFIHEQRSPLNKQQNCWCLPDTWRTSYEIKADLWNPCAPVKPTVWC